MLGNVCKKLLQAALREQEARDSQFYAGNFVETALLEHLFRYWLENTLGAVGFENIKREVAYPVCKKSTPRQACDLVGQMGNQKWWIELKVAYANTTYTKGELLADIERLSMIKRQDAKMYVAVFISPKETRPEKLEYIADNLRSVGVEPSYCSKPIPSPEHWDGWQNSHIHVLCARW